MGVEPLPLGITLDASSSCVNNTDGICLTLIFCD